MPHSRSRPHLLLTTTVVAALACASGARAGTPPVWTALTPPYVTGHGFVYVPTQNALYQIGGDVPLDYAPYEPHHEVKGGLWVWPLDGVQSVRTKGPIAAISQSPGVSPGQFVYEPVGNRILRIAPDVRVRQHDVNAATATFTTIVPTGTPPPEEGPIAFDADSARVLLVTRAIGHPEPVRVFALASTPGAEAWEELVSNAAPASLSMHARAVYDSVGRRLVVIDAGRPVGVTRVWALSMVTRTWSDLAPAVVGSAPGNLFEYAVAFDPIVRRAYVFGGRKNVDEVAVARMWYLELGAAPTWHDGPSFYTPEGRWGAGLAWDPARLRVWMCSGQTAESYIPPFETQWRTSQLWYFTGAPGVLGAWEMQAPPALPRTLERVGVAVDAANDRFFVHGGGIAYGGSTRLSSDSLWVVPFADPAKWTLVSGGQPDPVRRSDGDLVFDPLRNDLWAHGGNVNIGLGFLRRLHLTDPPLWESIEPGGTAPPPLARRTVRDARRDRLIVFTPNGAFFPALEVHALPLNGPPYTWEPLAVDSLSPALLGEFTATYDSVADRVLLVGGMIVNSGGGKGDPGSVSTDSVFALDLAVDPPAWRRLPPIPGGHAAVGRRNHVAALHPGERFLIVAGGEYYQFDMSNYGRQVMRDDVWLFSLDEPMTWVQLPAVPVHPRPRSHALGVFDPAREVFLYGGGSSKELPDGEALVSSGYSDDLWALSFDGFTPTRLDLVDAVATGDGASIRVRFSGEGTDGEVRVDRATGAAGDEWIDVGAALESTPGLYEFTDTDVALGATYRYRGRWLVDGAEKTTAASPPVTVSGESGSGTIALRARTGAILRTWPAEFEVRLPGDGPAVLELVDVTGRVVARQPIAAGTAGMRVVTLAPSRGAGSGLYFAQLRQGTRRVTERVVKL